MTETFYARIRDTLQEIDEEGLTKPERLITSRQAPEVTISHEGREIRALNFCANNYLGLADHPELIKAAQVGAEMNGYGMASVRFICGTQENHRLLEREIAEWLGFEDSITFAACFDANGAVFEPLLGKEDAIISDSLNHASIIDGVRLCKAQRFRYDNNDMASLEEQLKAADEAGARTKLVVTDGVFSMDGYIAQLDKVCALAEQYGALVMVDDCHATGFMGEGGRGTHEHCGVMGKVDILTGTLGKALGGGMGGFICARQEVVDLLRQRARPYLFSNALAPALVEGSRRALKLVREGDDLRAQLFANAKLFRTLMTEAGFDLLEGEHPIIPVMLYDAKVAQEMAAKLLDEGVFVTGFSFPVVPRGKARIRTQMNAAHTEEQVRRTVDAFSKVGRELGVI
ncbi:glycine C-acetyltransferase [Parvularcula sp. ZS-1/3]|uniref:2-amino-3-ketobutyrate coenzyme A ligase n=1 Tax=Parvularcula mediterranea TaxID=2732508 RepID=A0A7Y3W5M1_9PROT|nr:glycine C-acetyltransferase [Parvularcula mediterranea]NNU16462.1 glycine C-acetyltransferase [Parvularcula mediterranea]